jgi:hypothetical protein
MDNTNVPKKSNKQTNHFECVSVCVCVCVCVCVAVNTPEGNL